MYEPEVGEKVIIDPEADPNGRWRSIIFRVERVPTRVNEVNYVLIPVHGGRGLKVRAKFIRPHDETSVGADVAVVDVPMDLMIGTVVTFTGDPKKLFVVTDVRNGGHKLFELGGSHRYWRRVYRSQLTSVDVGPLVPEIWGRLVPPELKDE